MTNHDKGERSKERDRHSIERVENLYRRADALPGGFAEPEPPSLYKPVAENTPAYAEDDAQVAEDYSRDENESPFWILAVLEDMTRFAENHGHTDLENCLKDARRRAAKIISDMKTG